MFLLSIYPFHPQDPTSDLAVLSRKGSLLVRRYREEKERKKAQQKHWELAGTKMGNVLGIEAKRDDKDGKVAEDGSTDYKSDQQFADHIKGGSQAVSNFAKTRTLKQQRQFLPIFASRQQVSGNQYPMYIHTSTLIAPHWKVL